MATSGLPTPTVSSASDMLSASMVPGDLLAGLTGGSDTGADDTVDTGDAGEDAEGDAGPAIGDATGTEEPLEADGDDGAEPAEAAPAKDADPDKKADAEEELPEGVRKGKDRKGKEGYFLEENRYKTFHGNHQIVKQAAELMGEPLTVEALTVRNEALRNNERLYNDLSSGEPALQSNVVNDLLSQMGEAMKRGEVGIDPTVPFAKTVFSAIREKSPDGYASMMQMAARDLVTQLYDVAARGSDLNVASSAQRIAAVLSGVEPKPEGWTDQEYADYARNKIAESGFDFHTLEDLPKVLTQKRPERGSDLAAENAKLKAQLEGRTEVSPAAQFDSWQREASKAVNSSILDQVVKPALAGVEEKWKEFPNDYNDLVVDRLNRLVTKDVRADTELTKRIEELTTRARRATSAQVRSEVAARIQSEIVNRANTAVERHKADVLKFAATSLQGRSEATHERRNGAQNRTAPKGPSAPVKRSLAPVNPVTFKNNDFDRGTAFKQAMALINA